MVRRADDEDNYEDEEDDEAKRSSRKPKKPTGAKYTKKGKPEEEPEEQEEVPEEEAQPEEVEAEGAEKPKIGEEELPKYKDEEPEQQKYDYVFIIKVIGAVMLLLIFLFFLSRYNFPKVSLSSTTSIEKPYWWNSEFRHRAQINASKSAKIVEIPFNYTKYSPISSWSGIRFVGRSEYPWWNASPFYVEKYVSPISFVFPNTSGVLLFMIPTGKMLNFDPKSYAIHIKPMYNAKEDLKWVNATPLNGEYSAVFVKLDKNYGGITVYWDKNKSSQQSTDENITKYFIDFFNFYAFDSFNRNYFAYPSLVTFENRSIVKGDYRLSFNSLIISSNLLDEFQFAGVSTKIISQKPISACTKFNVMKSKSYDHAFEFVFSNQTNSNYGCFAGAYVDFYSGNTLTTQYGCGKDRNEVKISEIDPFKTYIMCLNINPRNYTILLLSDNFSSAVNYTVDFSPPKYGYFAFGSANGVMKNVSQNVNVSWFFTSASTIKIPDAKIVGDKIFTPSETVRILVNTNNETSFYIYFSEKNFSLYKPVKGEPVQTNATIGRIESYEEVVGS